MRVVHVVGAGPAGSAAALAALEAGARVQMFEKSPLPRHKVCGEFLSPEIVGVLARLGAWDRFSAQGPACVHRAALYFGERGKRWSLPAGAFGLSRYALDAMLLNLAVERGAELSPEAARPGAHPLVAARGRIGASPRGGRLFGFKAHFTGPADDAIELFFFSRCYAGVVAVENGFTNVCGIAPEEMLAAGRFRPDELIAGCRPLRERVAPLRRAMDWLVVGPLIFRRGFAGPVEEGVYPAGDALGFVDPFTGSGVLGALITGSLAGPAAARGVPVRDYLRACADALQGQYRAAAFFRAALRTALPGALARLLPGNLLFRLTRPRCTFVGQSPGLRRPLRPPAEAG